MDAVDRARAQWAAQRPDVDTSGMAVVARVLRLAGLVGHGHEAGLARHDLTTGEFEVLAALRRADEPLRAREIATLTSSPGATLTKRLDRLHGAGLVERRTLERDRRGVLVSLSDEGRAVIDAALPEQAARERDLLADLTDDERTRLADLLARVLETAEARVLRG
ncbi:MarR family transcriptional regulator [Cellulomonas chitinilytica]|uniref:MarR family transcriptional regulator n=1 Tax=Cellulomonas chitinilytica TaxID=398759 RepID=A0A919P2Z3_9CELL|nr:MarR family transcriptional regulator [Cellulomonas chitinilytica]GIG22362.1 MarR family transcriptional regulator [Cellulomonas chitinilytica]